MSAGDAMNSGFNPDAARYDRMNRTQPAQYAPGQGAVFQQQDAFAQSSMPNSGGAMGDIFSTGFGGAAAGGGVGYDAMNPFGQPGVVPGQPGGMPGMASPNSLTPQSQIGMQQPDAADKFWAIAGKFFAGAKEFITAVIDSTGQLTVRWYSEWGRIVAIVSGVVAGLGIVLKLFGVPFGFTITAGGALSAGSGLFMWLFLTKKARGFTSKYVDSNNSSQSAMQSPQSIAPSADSGFDFMSGGDDDFFGGSSSSFGDSSSSDWGDDDDVDPYDFSDENDPYAELDTTYEPASAGMSAEDALNSMPEVSKGMYTRVYLWDMFTKVLPTMEPGFAKMRNIDESNDVFLQWEDMLREAAGVAGCKEDFLPDLLELQENKFVIVVTCNRPQGFKSEVVASELANIYAYSGGTKNENVFAKVDNIGSRCKITIFNGEAVMISLKDLMLQEKDWICDTKNYIPVVLGNDQLGNVIKIDCKKLESIIVTGMPRSGKSWLVQAILTQMCAFVPPSELNIYICDPKDRISDFRDFRTLPHVKKFVSGDANIVKTLNNLVKVEAPRRKQIIGDAGFVNIWDYKERNPDVRLPVIYVVIDEIVTLASRMDKETGNEFRMLLRELISQLPALGIRAFMIPHVLNNDIIEKKTSDLVPCKVSVMGDADHIERATGSKFKEFPYRLVNKGDMAVKLTGFASTLYVHGPALTHSNPENSDLFAYLTRAWAKIEPGEHGCPPATGKEEPGVVLEAVGGTPIQVGNLDGTHAGGISPSFDSSSEGYSSGGKAGDKPVDGEDFGLGFDDLDGDDEDFQLF